MKKKSKKVEAEEESEYEVSESDDGLDEQDKILLESRHKKQDEDSEEEVFGIGESSSDADEEEDDDGELGSEFDSDIDIKRNDDDELIDAKAWGKDRKKYYNTDYVDRDFGGMSKEEEEDAEMEEQEAANIQKRLMSHLEETDFTLGLLDKIEEKKAELATKDQFETEKETISADLSNMSKIEKIQFLKHESPELFQLIDDYKEKLALANDKLRPVIGLIAAKRLKKCAGTDFISLYYTTILNYCTNISFYLLLKSTKRGPITDHPVISRLYSYRKLLKEMDDKMEDGLMDDLELLVEQSKMDKQLKFKELPPLPPTGNRAERRKKKRQMLAEVKRAEAMAELKKLKLLADEGKEKEIQEPLFSESSDEGEGFEKGIVDEEEEDDGESDHDTDVKEKRSITYEMSKNKGLTPRRKKENRNPRVKNRNKFRKAKIRRKGQVREARTETRKYDGEISGIKTYTVKSTKFKY